MSLILLCFISNFAINTEFIIKAYFQNMKPADYGAYYQPSYEELKKKVCFHF